MLLYVSRDVSSHILINLLYEHNIVKFMIFQLTFPICVYGRKFSNLEIF